MLERIQARLVDDWRDARHWWSVRWNALGAILLPLLTAVPSMPDEIQAMLPEWLRVTAAGLWCIAAIAFRLMAQKRDG
jgi:hypothetical protein